MLTKEMIEMISGYIERGNEKAIVACYENFTKINPCLELTMKFEKGDFQINF